MCTVELGLNYRLKNLVRSFPGSSSGLPRLMRFLAAGLFVVLFAGSSVDKWFHFPGFVKALGGYVVVPFGYAQPVAIFVASMELWLAIGFFVRIWRRTAAGMSCILLLSFAVSLWLNQYYGALTPCGCWFSIAVGKATRPHIVFDLVFSALAATIWFEGRRPARGVASAGLVEPQRDQSAAHPPRLK